MLRRCHKPATTRANPTNAIACPGAEQDTRTTREASSPLPRDEMPGAAELLNKWSHRNRQQGAEPHRKSRP